jgi:hypothetical protein
LETNGAEVAMQTRSNNANRARAANYTAILKITVLILAVFAWAGAATGQGTVWLNNRVTGLLVTHVYGPNVTDSWWQLHGNAANDTPAGTMTYTGTLLTGNGWTAQLWAAQGADRPYSELMPATPTTTFRTGGAAGQVAAVLATMPNVAKDSTVATVQMRVWPSVYPTWNAAYTAWVFGLGDASSLLIGESLSINVTNIGGDVNSPPYLIGLQSFNVIRGPMEVGPYLAKHPQSQSVEVGETVVFAVEAASNSTTNYQWSFCGSAIDGASTSALRLTNAQPAHAGPYSVTVWNTWGSVMRYLGQRHEFQRRFDCGQPRLAVCGSTQPATSGAGLDGRILLAGGNESGQRFR